MSTDLSGTVATAGLPELKIAFDKALEERQAVDQRIDEIRKAIAARLKEAQNLNNEANSVAAATTSTNSIKVNTESFDIDTKSAWRVFVKYILPAMIMLAILWLVMSFSSKSEPDAETTSLSNVPTMVASTVNALHIG